MNPLVKKQQQQQVAVATQFQKVCFTQGLHIDLGQAFECELELDPVRKARLARRFHHLNIRIEKSCGSIHLSNCENDHFDLSCEEHEEPEDGEVKLNEIMMMCPSRHRETVARVLMEMKRVGGSETITSSAPAVGIPRAVFYRILGKVRWWVTRPPMPEGWSGSDCSSLVQLSLDFGGGK